MLDALHRHVLFDLSWGTAKVLCHLALNKNIHIFSPGKKNIALLK